MKTKKIGAPPGLVQWLCAVLGILGISACDILEVFPADNQNVLLVVIAIALISTAALGSASIKGLRQQIQMLLDAKNAELDASKQKNAGLTTQLLEQAETLRRKDSEIQKLKEEREVWKKILMTQTPSQAGHYMANCRYYEKFKTELIVSRCRLDVELVQSKNNPTVRNLRFQWTLNILNPSPKPISKIKFIYSGDKDDISYPRAMVNGSSMRVSFDHFAEVTGDDRFMNIHYLQALRQNDTAKVYVEYTLEKYTYNAECDVIWFVPDALGFADVRHIYVRFLADGEVITETTTSLLRTYRLSGSYPLEIDEPIEYQTFEDGRAGFAFEKQAEEDELKQHGYWLVLTNGRDILSGSLGDIPDRN